MPHISFEVWGIRILVYKSLSKIFRVKMNLEQIQKALRDQQVDGWLFYDHHHRDPIAYRILGLSESSHISRRWYYLIPAMANHAS